MTAKDPSGSTVSWYFHSRLPDMPEFESENTAQVTVYKERCYSSSLAFGLLHMFYCIHLAPSQVVVPLWDDDYNIK